MTSAKKAVKVGLLMIMLVWTAQGYLLKPWNPEGPMAAGERSKEQPQPTPVRRALLIGINTYQPQGHGGSSPTGAVASDRPNPQPAAQPKGRPAARDKFTNLDGPRNDVREMRVLLEQKYGFTEITALVDQDATRDAILQNIESLIDRSARGDVLFIYYSGHGSRVRNSKNGEAKGYDESIVPADSNAGAPDIRDKELARHFLNALDKGVVLTAIFDSCHSGSIARGGPTPKRKSGRWRSMRKTSPKNRASPIRRRKRVP